MQAGSAHVEGGAGGHPATPDQQHKKREAQSSSTSTPKRDEKRRARGGARGASPGGSTPGSTRRRARGEGGSSSSGSSSGSGSSKAQAGTLKAVVARLEDPSSPRPIRRFVRSARKTVESLAGTRLLRKALAFPVAVITTGTLSVLCGFIVLYFGPNHVADFVALVGGAYLSCKALETDDFEQQKHWLIFWMVFALVRLLEFGVGFILLRFTLYVVCKIALLAFVFLRETRGSHQFYETVVKPLFLTHEATLDDHLETVSEASLRTFEEFLQLLVRALPKLLTWGTQALAMLAQEPATQRRRRRPRRRLTGGSSAQDSDGESDASRYSSASEISLYTESENDEDSLSEDDSK